MEETRYARSVKSGSTDVPFGEDLKRGLLRLVLQSEAELDEGIVIDFTLGQGTGPLPREHKSFGIKIVREY